MTPKPNIQRIWAIRDALLKPIEFAVRHDFARLGALKGLEDLGLGLVDEAISMRPGGGLEGRLHGLRALFMGFETRDMAEKRACLKRALLLLGPGMERDIAATAARNMERLSVPLSRIKGIGPRILERLEKKGLRTILDLLFFLPLRYEDRRPGWTIGDLARSGGEGLISATVAVAGETRYGRRRVFEVVVEDGTGILHLKWFHYRSSYMKRFSPGRRVVIYGSIRRNRYGGGLEMIHPDLDFAGDDHETEVAVEGIVPVYPEIEGIHQKTLRRIMAGVVRKFAPIAPGGVPPAALASLGLRDLPTALLEAHFPSQMPGRGRGGDKRAGPGGPGARDIAFDELFLLEVALLRRREAHKKARGLRSFDGRERPGSLASRLLASLPFDLTRAQNKALREIKADMAGPTPMNRLLQGDVGSGKTIVALLSALLAVDSGFQVALMAPTGILAEQHYDTIRGYVRGFGVRTCLLTGGLPRRDRDRLHAEIRSGGIDIVVGTHALIQDDIGFRNLGLAIVDEQQRFGVLQRASLRDKGVVCRQGRGEETCLPPDLLIMTATPIPRTLSMTIFGDLHVSVLDELPPGRRPVKTILLRQGERARGYDLIRREVRAGGRAYIVYPLVEESVELDLRDATNERVRLEREVFPGIRLGLIHGRMSGAEKEAVMRGFKAGEFEILVSTTVIEVGLHVPEATVICVEHAERFGLSQLHQLRGRVGRGGKESYCLLMSGSSVSDEAWKRLSVMVRSTDGFEIAEEDLSIRGPGDYLGKRQSGLADFPFTWALLDYGLVQAARRAAEALLDEYPGLARGPGPWICEALRARWSGRLELADVG